VNQDAFWVGTPFTGIPWMEAMLGCDVIATESSFVTRPTGATIETIENVALDKDDPWLLKYLEFVEALNQLSSGRFPVGEPIMRGPSDMLGSIIGQEAMVLALMMQPDRSKEILAQVTEAFIEVIRLQLENSSAFHDGYSFGFYNIWTPGKCIWYQEDLSALLSPPLFKEMLKPCGERICRGYNYTAIHLHPSSFFIIDEALTMDDLTVIQINKDIGGPTVAEMMGVCNKIIEKKNLIIWGDLTEEDLSHIRRELPPYGVALHIIAESVTRANELIASLE
jgi:hypothetical protein